MLRRTIAQLVSAADITTKLQAAPALAAPLVNVTDISAGCGSFFRVEVTSSAFKDKMMLQQHRMINEVLREEIKQIHGLTIITKPSE